MSDRFHAKEYPAYDKEVFPYNMGYCQVGKSLNNIFDFLQLLDLFWYSNTSRSVFDSDLSENNEEIS